MRDEVLDPSATSLLNFRTTGAEIDAWVLDISAGNQFNRRARAESAQHISPG
jgi:hypothetical protein